MTNTSLCSCAMHISACCGTQAHSQTSLAQLCMCCRSLSKARKASAEEFRTQINANGHTALPSDTSIEANQQSPSLPQEDTLLIEDTPQGKTVTRLAALQFGSPGYTPSPVPLRRRLQGAAAAFAPHRNPAKNVQASHDVICIDC